MSFETSAMLLTWIILALLVLAMGGMLRHVRNLTQQVQGQTFRPRGPAIGSRFPASSVTHANGRGQIVMFLRSDCRTCDAILPEIRRLSSLESGPSIAAVFRDQRPDLDLGRAQVVDNQSELFETLGIQTIPYVVVIRPDGTVQAARPVGSPSALAELTGVVLGEGR